MCTLGKTGINSEAQQSFRFITTHTNPDHTLTLRSNPLSSPGLDGNHRVSHSGNMNFHCFSLGFLGTKGRGNLVQVESESPDGFPRRLLSSPCPRGAVGSLARPHLALHCLPDYSQWTTVTSWHPQSCDKVLKVYILEQRQKNFPATISLAWSEFLPVPVAIDEHILGSCIQLFVVEKVKGEHISFPGSLPMASVSG